MKGSVDLERDSDWFIDNYDELSKKYAGQAIAIKDEEVIHSDEDYLRFLDHLREMEYDTTEILIEAIPEEDAAYIL